MFFRAVLALEKGLAGTARMWRQDVHQMLGTAVQGPRSVATTLVEALASLDTQPAHSRQHEAADTKGARRLTTLRATSPSSTSDPT